MSLVVSNGAGISYSATLPGPAYDCGCDDSVRPRAVRLIAYD